MPTTGEVNGPRADGGSRSAAAPDLTEHPEVNAFLEEIGTGPFRARETRSLFARNPNWMGTTEEGARVFVKKFTGPRESVAARMRRTIAHQRFTAVCTDRALAGPPCLGRDEERGLVAFQYLDGAVSGADLAEDGAFTPEQSRRVGEAIGSLHRARACPGLDTARPELPSVRPLEGLTDAEYENSSLAARALWARLQADSALRTGVAGLLERESAAPRVPVHGDLRIDQVLVTGPRLLLIDWEEFRVADPARDIGSFAGEWLHRAALGTAGAAGGADTFDGAVDAGARRLEHLRPQIESFWSGYRAVRPSWDPELPVRATAFAGWHLLDRAVSGAMNWPRLPARYRAAAGVGRAALLAPERFAPTLGLAPGTEAKT